MPTKSSVAGQEKRAPMAGQAADHTRQTNVGLAMLGRIYALIVLAATSMVLVWSMHHLEWHGRAMTIAVSIAIGVVASGSVGISIFPSLLMLALMSSGIEGAYQGFHRDGWSGSIVGGLVGAIGGILIVVLPFMLVHLILALRGIDPFEVATPPPQQSEEIVYEKVERKR